MSATADLMWFDLLVDAVAHYIDDDTSEVYAMRPNAPHFARVRTDDQTIVVTLLTNDRAELVAGEARLTHLPAPVLAATIEAMLGDADG